MNHVTHPLISACISFFYRKLANFAISRNTDIIAFWYIISKSSNFFGVFKYFFNKHGNNFDDVIKNSYPRPS